jgi:hypothetical protein
MPTISETVRLRGNDEVELEIVIGSGQIGGFSVLLESRELEPTHVSESRAKYPLGKADDVRFTVLIGTVKVRDVNKTSNQTTITATVRQGATERIFKDREEAQPDGIVTYGLAISFV